ncbi:hypothetical protein QG516_06485 [Pedobacter gandavensis]|uniref:hypothetical protein n=1 Tax=Pedobacter gandavensis TaxID=2679963 RepID=UPI002478C821|nr:hypothetical protein [Pedobacter gandavensis]WGQ11301.1 hypothetical protein QG516_06485 [Pedobacter gandavensis]
MEKGIVSGLIRNAGIFGLLLFVLADSSCKQSTDPFANFNVYDEGLGKRIETYHHTISSNTNALKTGNPAIYIDFSSGINKAFADPVIKGMMTDCFNTVLADKFDVYKLGLGKITALNVANTTELGQQVSDATQYSDIYAPIQSAVEKIVEGNHDALLITDFEEWQKNSEVTNTAFLKIPFSKWLGKGNSIHFFIVDYKEGKVDKHLYFTVFNSGRPTPSSMISKLESKLAPLSTRFDLSNVAYQLQTKYSGAQSGGIFYDEQGKSDQKNVLDLKAHYINGLKKGDSFEFYPLGLDWKNIDKLHTAYTAQGQFNDFFRKLFIDLSNNDSYTFGEFDVRVLDVTSDFESFSKSEEAVKHKPKLVTGSNGETKVDDHQNDVIASGCYTNDGKLKEEWLYKSSAGSLLNDIFILNKALFTNTKNSDQKNTEIAVSFDPKFNLKNIQNPDALIKVDILLVDAKPNLQNSKLSKFQWMNANQVPNVALYESIRNTLEEVKPVNKNIYSYYIKTKQ